MSGSEIRLDFSKWTPNIRVTVWGAGKATLTEKERCPVGSRKMGQQYAGDCDNCAAFMGHRIEKPIRDVQWGDSLPACCWIFIEPNAALSGGEAVRSNGVVGGPNG